jgi:DNA-binding CsgD family transcriptional regulator
MQGGWCVTERDQSVRDESVEEAIRSRRWLLDGMLRPFPFGAFNVVDRELRYLYAAGTAFDQLGLSPDMFIGRLIEDFYPAEVVDRVRPFYARAFAGETVAFTLPAIGREYSIHAWPLTEPDGTINAIVALAKEAPTQPGTEMLSPRLRDVAALIAAGLTNQQIAGRLQLRSATVRNHVEQIMKRLGFASRTQIGVWAVMCGLYHPEEDGGGRSTSASTT